ncbi:MAG: type transport system ATP-binding protein [Solirubrobacteraceae bacterium]|nr:type transport system ATP-binding protein [Solirubrobacteraceae bacterium]
MSAEPAGDVAVQVDGVSKTFRLPKEQVHTLKERALHPFRRSGSEALRALRDVGFEVHRGEVFGIVGRNGSGKSTLMKCLAGIYQADQGEMWLRGRMAPFIELGVGFNPDLTAHDNVLINAVMLGLTPDEARRRYDSIVDFAELHEFSELKLKNYSSGMQVRLAFSVMVHVDADLLLIDEVLAVGDAAFQQKCFDVLNRMRDEGRTILLVTHDMTQVQRFCDRAMLLERGEVVIIGDPKTVTRRYTQVNFPVRARGPVAPGARATGGERGAVELGELWAQDGQGNRGAAIMQGTPCAICAAVHFGRAMREPVITFWLSDDQHRRVFAISTANEDVIGDFPAGSSALVGASFDNWLSPGRYDLSVQITEAGPGAEMIALRENAGSVVVSGETRGDGIVDIPHAFFVNHISSAPQQPQAAVEGAG